MRLRRQFPCGRLGASQDSFLLCWYLPAPWEHIGLLSYFILVKVGLSSACSREEHIECRLYTRPCTSTLHTSFHNHPEMWALGTPFIRGGNWIIWGWGKGTQPRWPSQHWGAPELHIWLHISPQPGPLLCQRTVSPPSSQDNLIVGSHNIWPTLTW